jgi:hypothetical protein
VASADFSRATPIYGGGAKMKDTVNTQQVFVNNILKSAAESVNQSLDKVEEALKVFGLVNYQNLSGKDQEAYKKNLGVLLLSYVIQQPAVKALIEGETVKKGSQLSPVDIFSLVEGLLNLDGQKQRYSKAGKS